MSTFELIYVRVQRMQELDRRAERIATLTRASCALPLLLQQLRLLLLLLFLRPRLLLAADDFFVTYDSVRRLIRVQHTAVT